MGLWLVKWKSTGSRSINVCFHVKPTSPQSYKAQVYVSLLSIQGGHQGHVMGQTVSLSQPRSNPCIEVPTPVPQNRSGDKVFKDVVKGKRSPSDGPSPSISSVLIRIGNKDIDTHRGKITWKQGEVSRLRAKERDPANTLILSLKPLELPKNKLLLLVLPSLGYVVFGSRPN